MGLGQLHKGSERQLKSGWKQRQACSVGSAACLAYWLLHSGYHVFADQQRDAAALRDPEEPTNKKLVNDLV